MRILLRSALASGLIWLVCLSSPIHAQGTAFSYHGRLNDNAQAANGSYDFKFTVYNSEAAGAVVGQPVAIDDVAVNAGQFTATIDPGEGVFTGAPRWLEIAVRAHGAPEDHTILAPRQSLLPTPYAVFAGSAGNVATGALTASQLNTGGVAPTPGQFLSYDGGKFIWSDPGAAAGNVWSLNGADAYYTAGKVGIGTSTPANLLTVFTPTLDYGIEHTDGDIRLSTFVGRGTGYLGTRSNHKLTFFANDNGFANMTMTLDTTGGVGIGTDTPQAKLHTYDPAASTAHLIETGGGVNAWTKVAFRNANGEWDIGTSRSFNNDVFYIDRLGNTSLDLQLSVNGALGLGIEPQAKMHLYEPNNSLSHRIQTGGGINAWTRVEFVNANGQWDVGTSRGYNGDQLYFYREGSPNIAFAVQPNGDAYLEGLMSCKVLTIRGGADVAEPFAMPETITKGSVVVIDDAHPGQLKLSTEAYDQRVAGVVSGANGINPGIALHQEGALEGGQNVALSGRVYVDADASFGAIKPGDLLTTSATPGHAMRVSDHHQSQGAILGKAMTPLTQGRGTVLVLVTLQ